METIKRLAPAVWAYIYGGGKPQGCSVCPYSVRYEHQGVKDLQTERFNPAAPDRAWYDCRLLSQGKFWGERPGCEPQDWDKAAHAQLMKVLQPSIVQQCDIEEANALFNSFWAAIWDDRNAARTGREIREELMKEIRPSVKTCFELLLKERAAADE